jgi:hypothetical protein
VKSSNRLTKSELQAIEYEVSLIAGDPPTIEDLQAAGHHENARLNQWLDTISGVGRVITLLVAEIIQAGAVLIIAVLFAALEYQRVQAGSIALGQSDGNARLIAVAIVAANVIHPIYTLRALRGSDALVIKRQTLIGWLQVFWARLWGQSETKNVDLYHNPTLHLAAAMITWTTIILAVYDILGPLLTELSTGALSKPLTIALMELLMGLGLSVAGVFFLQSASHEIGVRTLTDQPERLADKLAERRAAYDARVDQLREEARARILAGKQQGGSTTPPVPLDQVAPQVVPSLNGRRAPETHDGA